MTSNFYDTYPDDPMRRGQVTDRDECMLYVNWISGFITGWFKPEELEALCHNCFMVHEDHADNEKCLYQPTYWKGPYP
jgi:hypothetical protein